MPYIFRPRKQQADQMAAIADHMTRDGYPMSLSRLYELVAEKAIAEYRVSPPDFFGQLTPFMEERRS